MEDRFGSNSDLTSPICLRFVWRAALDFLTESEQVDVEMNCHDFKDWLVNRSFQKKVLK